MFYSVKKPQTGDILIPPINRDCIDLYKKDGRVLTRKGMKLSYTDELFTESDRPNVRIIDQRSPVVIDGQRCKVFFVLKTVGQNTEIVLKAYCESRKYICHVVTVGGVDSKEYYRCIAFNGTPHTGSGVYVMFSSIKNEQVNIQGLYELNDQKNGFVRFSDDDYYAPTVLYHGRGNRFYLADENIRSSIKAPENGQPFNIMSGRFCAKYRTDGVSSTFYMPRSPLEYKKISITMRGSDGQTYNWTIPADSQLSTGSQNVTFVVYNEQTGAAETTQRQVSMYVYRASGSITAYVGSTSSEIALPYVEGSQDNLTVTATLEDNGSKPLLKCADFFTVESKSGAGSSVALFDSEQKKIYFSSPNEPMYFPESNSCEFDCTADGGFSSFRCKDTVFIVFSGEIYAAKQAVSHISGGVTAYNTMNIIKTGAYVRNGCENSCAVSDGRLYFLSANGHICSVSSGGYDVKRESEKDLSDLQSAYAAVYDGKYLLIGGGRGIFADDSINEFDMSAAGGEVLPCISGEMIVRLTDKKIAAYAFGGGYDQSLSKENVLSERQLFGRYLVKNCDSGTTDKKTFYKLILTLRSENSECDCTLRIENENGIGLTRRFTAECAETYIREINMRQRARCLCVSLTLPSGVEIKEGRLFYTK